MSQSLSDFKLKYDSTNPVLKQNKESALKDLTHCLPAFRWFTKHPSSTVHVSQKANAEIKFLLGLDRVFGEVIPPLAKYKAFSENADLGFYKVVNQMLTPSSPDDDHGGVKGFQAVVISDYHHGKLRQATNGQITFSCTITITEDAWRQVERMNASPDQIKGILLQDPILISQKSKQMGVRCIKPEPYGWIFSTSVSSRLVATNVAVTTINPTVLNFTTVESGH